MTIEDHTDHDRRGSRASGLGRAGARSKLGSYGRPAPHETHAAGEGSRHAGGGA